MKLFTMFVMAATAMLSSSAFATVYTCGALKAGGGFIAGGPRYSVAIVGKELTLITKSPGRLAKPKRTVMKPKDGVLNVFWAGDIDARVKRFEGKISINIFKASNPEWTAECLL